MFVFQDMERLKKKTEFLVHWSWASYSLSGLSEKILVNINFFREIEKLSNSASSFGTTESQESLLVQKYPPLIFFTITK